MRNNKKYLIREYTDSETIFFKNRSLPAYSNIKSYIRTYVDSYIFLDLDKKICKKHNGKITEKENGEVVLEYNTKEYSSYPDIDLRFINNSKNMIIYMPISNDELTSEFLEEVKEENDMYEFLFDKI